METFILILYENVLISLNFCDHMDYSPPGSPVHGILQARILEWVAMPSPQGTSLTQGLNLGLLHCRQILYHLSRQGCLGWSYLLKLPSVLRFSDSSPALIVQLKGGSEELNDLKFHNHLVAELEQFLTLCLRQAHTAVTKGLQNPRKTQL